MGPPSPEAKGSPLVLLINDEEWTTRSLDMVLKAHGYAVLLAYTGRQGLDLASKIRPDIVLIDYKLPDMTGEDLCARIREMPTVNSSTPLLVVTGRSLDRAARISCLESGAWDVLRLPFDPDAFLIRLGTYLEAKRDADRAREERHLDPSTGFYNVQGLTKRVAEVAADAIRHNRPLACVALGVKPPETFGSAGDEEEDSSAGAGRHPEMIAEVLAMITRVSDVVARVGENDFIVIAPATDQVGVQRLADRVLESLGGTVVPPPDADGGASGDDSTFVHLRAGYHAIDHPLEETVLPEDLLTRATAALRRAQTEEKGSWIRAFDSSEPN